MSILSKVTLGFVVIAALFFVYSAMRTLKTHQAWRSGVKQHEDAIAKVAEKTESMMEGNPEQGKLALGQLKVSLDAAIFGRGRVWTNVAPWFDAGTGNVIAAIEQPQPHQLQPNMLLQAFQGLDAPGTGRYIGEFKVTAADANSVTLASTYPPTASRRTALQQARGPWTLYQVLPSDTNELFSGTGEDGIREMLPQPPRQLPGEAPAEFQARQKEHEQLIQEYVRDSKPIDRDDPPPAEQIQVVVKFVKDQADLDANAKADLRKIDFGENLVKSGAVMKTDLKTATELVRLGLAQEVERRYQRKLRDYSYVLREFHRRLPILEDQIANLQRDLDYMTESNAEAEKHLAENQAQEQAMQQELALVDAERQVVSQYRDTLAERLETINGQIARLADENRQLAAQLVQRQLQAVQAAGRSASATALAKPAR